MTYSFKHLSIIDWDQFAERYGKPAIQKMVLNSLLNHHSSSPEELRKLVSENNHQATEILAHKLKGAAGIISAPCVAEIARSLESKIQVTQLIDAELAESLANAMIDLLATAKEKLNTLSS